MTEEKKEDVDYISVIVGKGKLATRISGPRKGVEEFVSNLNRKDKSGNARVDDFYRGIAEMRTRYYEMKIAIHPSDELIECLRLTKIAESFRSKNKGMKEVEVYLKAIASAKRELEKMSLKNLCKPKRKRTSAPKL